MGEYDLTYKELIRHGRSNFVQLITGQRVQQSLSEVAGRFRERDVDALVRLEDGSYVQIELQNKVSDAIYWRLLDYNIELHHRFGDVERARFPTIRQILISVGGRTSPPEAQWSTNGITAQFESHTIEGMCDGGRELFASPYPYDWILGLLCIRTRQNNFNVHAYDNVWRQIVARVEQLHETVKQDCFALLQVIVRWRPVSDALLLEIKTMPIIDNIEDVPMLKHAWDKGDRHARIETLMTLVATGDYEADDLILSDFTELTDEECTDILLGYRNRENPVKILKPYLSEETYRRAFGLGSYDNGLPGAE